MYIYMLCVEHTAQWQIKLYKERSVRIAVT